jgi:hypothetical protein
MVERVSRRRFIGCSVGSALAAAVATETFEGFVPPQYGLQQLFPNNPLELLKKYQDSQRKAEEKEQEALRLTKEKQNLVDQLSKTETSKKELLIRIAETEDIYKQAISEMESYRKNANNALNLLMKLFSDNKEKLGAGAEYGIKSVEVIRDQASRSSSLQVQLTVLTNQLDDISSFSSKVSDFLNQYNEDPLASLAGVNSVVTEFRSKIGRTITQPIESSVSIISSQKAQIDSLNKRFEAPEPVKIDSEVRVAAYYLTGWSIDPNQRSSDWSLGSAYTPMLGAYRSDDPFVADWHIKWALEHGIDTFIVLYGDTSWRSSEALEKGLMKSRYFDKISFAIMFGTWPWMPNNPFGINSDDIFNVAKFSTGYIADKFFGKQNYLRLGGRPVYEIGYLWNWADAVGIDRATRLVQTIRDTAQERGFDIFLVGDVMTRRHDSPIIDALIEELDAITNYSIPEAGGTWKYHSGRGELVYPYDDYISGILKEAAHFYERVKSRGKHIIQAIQPGMSNRVLYEKGVDDWLIEYTGSSPNKFKSLCQLIEPYLDADLNMIAVEAFNEFQEGSVLEPHTENGFSYMNSIKYTYAIKPSSGWPKEIIPGQLYYS